MGGIRSRVCSSIQGSGGAHLDRKELKLVVAKRCGILSFFLSSASGRSNGHLILVLQHQCFLKLLTQIRPSLMTNRLLKMTDSAVICCWSREGLQYRDTLIHKLWSIACTE